MKPLKEVYLTVAQTRAIDRLAVEQYRMPSIVLMENAARSALAAILAAYPPAVAPRAALLIGAGNNGGDGLALARLMHNAGYACTLLLASDAAKFKGDALVNYDISAAMKLPTASLVRGQDELDLAVAAAALASSDFAVDGLLGTGLKGAVRPPLSRLIDLANDTPSVPVVALDVPSGFDADEGMPSGEGEGVAIIAVMTISFAANKVGYRQPGAAHYTGRVVVGDIGVPRELIDGMTAAT